MWNFVFLAALVAVTLVLLLDEWKQISWPESVQSCRGVPAKNKHILQNCIIYNTGIRITVILTSELKLDYFTQSYDCEYFLSYNIECHSAGLYSYFHSKWASNFMTLHILVSKNTWHLLIRIMPGTPFVCCLTMSEVLCHVCLPNKD